MRERDKRRVVWSVLYVPNVFFVFYSFYFILVLSLTTSKTRVNESFSSKYLAKTQIKRKQNSLLNTNIVT